MSVNKKHLFLRIAAVLTLLSSVVMVYALLFPKPLTVVLAMSAGQGIGILGVVIYFGVILTELVERRVLRLPGAKESPKP